MENASKALIIAGAILISIVLVSVGVIVVQSLNPDEALSQMTQQEIDNFNSKFVSGQGVNKQGVIAKSLISSVITNNSEHAGDTGRIIKVTIANNGSNNITEEDDPNELSKARNYINGTYRYDIDIKLKSNGLVDVITITRK